MVYPAIITDNTIIDKRSTLLLLRLIALILLVYLLTIHLRSLRVFKFEQTYTGGVLVTNCISEVGLAMFAGGNQTGGKVFQVFLCASGAVLLAVNAGVIMKRWSQANEMTRAVTELLESLGIMIRRQIIVKSILSMVVTVVLLSDMTLMLLLE